MNLRSLLVRTSRFVQRRGGPATHLPRWIKNLELRTVLDIGANTGQFAQEIRGAAPQAQIYSFEPLPDCHAELTRRFAHDSRFRAFCLGLGDVAGDSVIHRSVHSQSSSLLPMEDLHRQAFPYSDGQTEVKIRVERLDDLQDRLALEAPLLAKLDVQGFEDRVITGGRAVLRRAQLIIVELTVEALYRGQPLFDDVNPMLRDLGFVYHGNLGQLLHPEDGRVLQLDAIYLPAR